jgi:hypothetical protein
MANPRMTLLDLLNKAEQGADPDFPLSTCHTSA